MSEISTRVPVRPERPEPPRPERPPRPSRTEQPRPSHNDAPCWPDPFERLAYFHGQMLSSDDLRTEQAYFREKHKLHNRCLHGWGVVCGLRTAPLDCPDPEAEKLDRLVRERDALEERLLRARESGEATPEMIEEIRRSLEAVERQIDQLDDPDCPDAIGPHFTLDSGLALDCEGNEILVHRSRTFSVWDLLSEREKRLFRRGRHSVWIHIRYVDRPSHPVRPVLPDACGIPRTKTHGRWRDHWEVTATLEAPDPDTSCETCCDGCCDGGVLLTRFDAVSRGRQLDPDHIHDDARRMLAKYVPTRITGVSWTHGAEYTRDEVEDMLRDGLVIRFSRDVRAESVRPGVMDIWVVDGGMGRNGNIWRMQGDYHGLPSTGWVREVVFRNVSGEVLNGGDRVLITFRGEFVLDACCQPVAGTHVGGKVPVLESHDRWRRERPDADVCAVPPSYPAPWTSGSTLLGGTRFESWFYLADRNRTETPR